MFLEIINKHMPHTKQITNHQRGTVFQISVRESVITSPEQILYPFWPHRAAVLRHSLVADAQSRPQYLHEQVKVFFSNFSREHCLFETSQREY